ncbi:hypothetical protein B4W72_08155 [Staphylococcus delphini]|nr:hypothetical protein B5P37_06155 [Staphylococcus lutrae]PCF56941.1 hypothetical protein B5C08_02250 [Staphylococcus delphini]PCF63128.1 hypothetical protein B5C01_02655 [Staphylococcus delphini]PCF72739.1 hypothetical protein B4W72_08155 [Staphylococcus delphini]
MQDGDVVHFRFNV